MNKKLMNSGYPRIPNDEYHTIDPRCVYAFLEHFKPVGTIVDVCSPSGSGIVDTFRALGFNAIGIGNAWADFRADWVVTNPPYTRGLVDKIIWAQIHRVMHGEINGFASLHRWGFDHAASRFEMFAENPYYFGQIKTLFRPKWIDGEQVVSEGKKEHQPFHPYIWHIWKPGGFNLPSVMYSKGEKPK